MNHALAGAATAIAVPALVPLGALYYAGAIVSGTQKDIKNKVDVAVCSEACNQFWNGLYYGMGYWLSYYIYVKYIGIN